MALSLAIITTVSLVACGRNSHGTSSQLSSKTSSAENSSVASRSQSSINSPDMDSELSSEIPKAVEDEKSSTCKNIASIFAKEFPNMQIIPMEYHLQSDASKKTISAEVYAASYDDSFPDKFIDACKSAFVLSHINESQYNSLLFTISGSSGDDRFAICIIRDDASSEWKSSVGLSSGPHKDAYQLAYEKSSFFSKMDTDKSYQDSLDSIKSQYDID